MASRVRGLKPFAIIIFLALCQAFAPGLCPAQKANAGPVHFSQKLSWTADANAFEYKVEVQNTDSGESDFFTSEQSSITFSKPAGNYRYRVTAIDFLGRESSVSDWRNFKITRAVQPVIISAADSASFKGDSAHDSGKAEIPLKAEGLVEGSEFELADESSGKTIIPELVEKNGDEKLVAQNIYEGTFTLRIKNPGGLEARKSGIRIVKDNSEEIAAQEAEAARLEAGRLAKEEEERRAEEARLAEERRLEEERRKLLGGPEFFLGAGYALPAELLDGTLGEYTDRKFYPASAALRTSLVFVKTRALNLGLGIDASYSRISGEKDGLSLKGNLMTGIFCAALQKPLVRNKINLEARAGGGVGMLHNLQYTFPSGKKTRPLKTWDFAFGGGITVQYLYTRRFYAEVNVDYVHCLFNDMTLGVLNPSLCAGIKL